MREKRTTIVGEWAKDRLRLLERAVSATQNGVMITDASRADDPIVYVNPAFERITGYSSEEAIGRNPRFLQAGDDDQPALDELKAARRAKGDDSVEWTGVLRNYRKDGALFYNELTAAAVRDEEGRVANHIGVMTDVTQRKRAEEALRESERRFRQLFENSADALFVLHPETREIVDCNQEACRSLGYSREELLGLRLENFASEILSEEEKERKGSDTPWRRALGGEPGTIIGFHENEHRRKDGTAFPVEVGVGSIDYAGRRMILASCRDLTERRTLEGRIAHQAFHDPLTGLPNRTLFFDRLEHALARAGRGRECVAVLFMDLDDFKDVNDSLGHEAGDELLVAVAERLRGCIRPEDTVARLGGDEFVVLLETSAGEREVLWVAERMKEALGNPFVLQGHERFATASIGVAFNGSGWKEKPGQLLREADVAMYAAKRAGKSRLEVFAGAMHTPALKRLGAQADLRRALKRGELALRYQPKVDLKSGKIACVEALAYWEHPERGLVPPTEFIPIAEETGLIVPLGRQVLREACGQAKKWQALSPKEGPPLTVSVNLSARQFDHEDLAKDVARALWESGLAAAHLILEITEGVVMEDAPRTARIMSELKALGVKLSIDDFGTGYSSLSYLRRFPVEYLKIDRSFVERLDEEPGDAVVASGILSLAHAMGLKVVAEGVETEGQLQKLEEMGCDMAQGYLFSRPLPPEAAAELLSAAPPRRWRRQAGD